MYNNGINNIFFKRCQNIFCIIILYEHTVIPLNKLLTTAHPRPSENPRIPFSLRCIKGHYCRTYASSLSYMCTSFVTLAQTIVTLIYQAQWALRNPKSIVKYIKKFYKNCCYTLRNVADMIQCVKQLTL